MGRGEEKGSWLPSLSAVKASIYPQKDAVTHPKHETMISRAKHQRVAQGAAFHHIISLPQQN